MILDYGVGPDFVGSTGGDGLDFDVPDLNWGLATSAFAEILTDGDWMLFAVGVQGTGAERIQFRIDVPDVSRLSPGFGHFTLRQIPAIVPEPTTLAIVCLAIAGTAIRACSRTGQQSEQAATPTSSCSW